MTKRAARGVRMPWLLRTPRALVCLLILVSMVALALLAPYLNLPDPGAVSGKMRFAGPSLTHLLGADSMGRDILSNIAFGARTTLAVSCGSILIALSFGLLIGTTAGFARGWVESLLMRFIDTILCFPPILLAIFVLGFLGPDLLNLTVVIGFLYIPRFARIAYSSTLSVAQTTYVESARAVGVTPVRIVIRHIIPNILAPIFVQISLGLGQVILTESALSFLGLGPAPPTASWGRMINFSRRFMHIDPMGVVWPALAIALTVIALNMLGDTLRDRLDPRIRGEA
jgi:peptide/nickel transport system permease protein